MRSAICFGVILFFLVPRSVMCFMSWGDIDENLAYEDFELLPDDSGYSFTLINKSTEAMVDSYIVVYGLGIMNQVVYRYGFRIRFLEGEGTYSTVLPPSTEEIWQIRFEVYGNFDAG